MLRSHFSKKKKTKKRRVLIKVSPETWLSMAYNSFLREVEQFQRCICQIPLVVANFNDEVASDGSPLTPSRALTLNSGVTEVGSDRALAQFSAQNICVSCSVSMAVFWRNRFPLRLTFA